MKTLYLECNMGAAGDMLMAALLELIPDKAAFIDRMNHLGLPGVEVALETSVKCGVTGSHVRVLVHGEEELSEDIHEHHVHDHEHEHHDHQHHEHHHDHEHSHHHHASMADITAMIDALPVSDMVKADAQAVYQMARLMLKHTTTLGVRRMDCSRYVMNRSMETVETAYGPIRVKHADGFGVSRRKAEYEDVAKATRRAGVSIQQVTDTLKSLCDPER